ncbi:MAG: hypothetical protein KF901_09500 [Myxococcales bacterium]|nr:hypothetical protein [Myxococcales bacterium]
MAPDSRKARLEGEVSRLRGLRADLERDWRRLPWYMSPAVGGLPAFFVWGPFVSSTIVAGSVTLTMSAAYLIGVRRKEYDSDIREVLREIAILDAAAEG